MIFDVTALLQISDKFLNLLFIPVLVVIKGPILCQ